MCQVFPLCLISFDRSCFSSAVASSCPAFPFSSKDSRSISDRFFGWPFRTYPRVCSFRLSFLVRLFRNSLFSWNRFCFLLFIAKQLSIKPLSTEVDGLSAASLLVAWIRFKISSQKYLLCILPLRTPLHSFVFLKQNLPSIRCCQLIFSWSFSSKDSFSAARTILNKPGIAPLLTFRVVFDGFPGQACWFLCFFFHQTEILWFPNQVFQ